MKLGTFLVAAAVLSTGCRATRLSAQGAADRSPVDASVDVRVIDLHLVSGSSRDPRTAATVLVLKTGKRNIAYETDAEVCVTPDRVRRLAEWCGTPSEPVEACENSPAQQLAHLPMVRSCSEACTGVVWAADEIATVHHCLPCFPGLGGEDPRADALLVVGHTSNNARGDTICFPRGSVMEVVERTRFDGDGDDDIVAYKVKPYGMSVEPNLRVPDFCDADVVAGAVEVRGHPFGLPQTRTTQGSLHLTSDGLKCSVESFGGNSGSPIFLEEQDCVAGLLSTALSSGLNARDGCCELDHGINEETVSRLFATPRN